MKRFKLLAIAFAAVLVMGAVGCTSSREITDDDYPVNRTYYDVGVGLYSPYYYGGGYYRPRTYIRSYPVHNGGWGHGGNWGHGGGGHRH